MPESLSTIGGGVKNAWSNLNKPQRIIVISSGAVVLILLMILVITSAKGPDYEVLWSNLDPTDAGEIVNELRNRASHIV